MDASITLTNNGIVAGLLTALGMLVRYLLGEYEAFRDSTQTELKDFEKRISYIEGRCEANHAE